MTEAPPLQQVQRTYVLLNRRKLSYFSGCDYFRLSSHPKVVAASREAARRYGLNVAASRVTTGNHLLYQKLETALASYFGAQTATVVATGYLSNIVAAQALAGNFSHALVDEWSHPSLSDAARFLDCPILQFKHADAEDVARTVKRCGPHSKLLLITDGMFSRDGSAAPLRSYLPVLPKDAMLMVDDAHGGGVLGKTGKGTPEHEGISRSRLVQTVTLSKAFGGYGGAVLGSAELRRKIFERSRSFIGATPVPLPMAAAALEGIAILKRTAALRQRLFDNCDSLRRALAASGVTVPENPGPIVAQFPTEAETPRLEQRLLKAGILPPFIRYPGAPAAGYFRFVISSEHRPEQLKQLAHALAMRS